MPMLEDTDSHSLMALLGIGSVPALLGTAGAIETGQPVIAAAGVGLGVIVPVVIKVIDKARKMMLAYEARVRRQEARELRRERRDKALFAELRHTRKVMTAVGEKLGVTVPPLDTQAQSLSEAGQED